MRVPIILFGPNFKCQRDFSLCFWVLPDQTMLDSFSRVLLTRNILPCFVIMCLADQLRITWHKLQCDICEQAQGQCSWLSSFCQSQPKDRDGDIEQGNQTVSALIVSPSVESQTRGRSHPKTAMSQSSEAPIRHKIFNVCFCRTSSVSIFRLTVKGVWPVYLSVTIKKVWLLRLSVPVKEVWPLYFGPNKVDLIYIPVSPSERVIVSVSVSPTKKGCNKSVSVSEKDMSSHFSGLIYHLASSGN